MIEFFYKSVKSKQVQTLNKFKKGVWINIVSPSDEELDEISEEYKLERSLLDDALDENEMPRMEREKENLYIFTRFPYRNVNNVTETAPILIIVGEKAIFTLSTIELPRINMFTHNKIAFSTTQKTKLLLQILDQIVDLYDYELTNISRKIKSIRSQLRIENITNRDFIDFVLIEDVINEFMSALTPTNSILRRILASEKIKLYAEDKNLIEDLLLKNQQSIEASRSALKTIVNIREAYSTIMGNNLNRVIRLLTVLTVILSIPTLIASTWGMNVSLPFQESEHGFVIIMLIAFLSSLALLYFFKKNKWL